MQNACPNAGVISATNKTWWTSNMGAEYAVAADLNPGTSPTATDNVFKPTATSSAKDMKLGNSNNHDKDGQNILYGDGHVSWESNPFVGVNRDNIYTAMTGSQTNQQENTGTVGKLGAYDANDSVLLPTDDNTW